MVDDARADIDIVKVNLLGIGGGESRAKAEETVFVQGFVNTLCFNDINTRIVVESL